MKDEFRAHNGPREESGIPKGGPIGAGVDRLRRLFHRRSGVTLLELLVVVIILAILVATGVPNYQRALERGYFREAQDLLLTIYSGQRAYFFINDYYLEPPGTGLWRDIHLDDPNDVTSLPVGFSIDVDACGAPPPCFSAEADRGGGKVMTIDEDRDLNTSSWPMP